MEKAVQLDLSTEEIAMFAQAAHKKNVTLNQWINDALRSFIIDKLSDDVEFLERMSAEKTTVYKRLKESIEK